MESGRSFFGGLMGRPLTPLLLPAVPLFPIIIPPWLISMPITIPGLIPSGEPWSIPREVSVSGESRPPPIPRPIPLTPMVPMMGMAMVVGVVVSAFLFTPFFCGGREEDDDFQTFIPPPVKPVTTET